MVVQVELQSLIGSATVTWFKCSHCTCSNAYNVPRTCGYNYNHWFVYVLLPSLASNTKTECHIEKETFQIDIQ